jgi:hypothetical protein
MKAERLNFLKKGMKRYKVDLDKGIVYRLDGKPMKPYKNEGGYLRVSIFYKGKQKIFYVHQVIAYMGGLDMLNKTVNHIDGNKENNSIANLETLSLRENMEHAFAMGLKKGKFVSDVVKKAIVNNYNTRNYTMTELGKRYEISTSSISNIIIEANNGKTQYELRKERTA